MDNYKSVTCSQCGKRIANLHKKIKTTQVIDCRNCRTRNIYNPVTDETIKKDIPIRATSSGIKFI